MCIFQGIFQDVIYLSSLGPYLKNEVPCFFELISHFTYGLSQPVPFRVVNLWLTAQLPLLHPSDSKASFHGSCGSLGDLLVLFFACLVSQYPSYCFTHSWFPGSNRNVKYNAWDTLPCWHFLSFFLCLSWLLPEKYLCLSMLLHPIPHIHLSALASYNSQCSNNVVFRGRQHRKKQRAHNTRLVIKKKLKGREYLWCNSDPAYVVCRPSKLKT